MTPEERAAATYQSWGAHETVATIKGSIAAAIREAVEAERKRCAGVVAAALGCDMSTFIQETVAARKVDPAAWRSAGTRAGGD
jgi:hypothetical protein